MGTLFRSAMSAPATPTLTLDQAKEMLTKLENIFTEKGAEIKELREAAGGDPAKTMMTVMPKIIEYFGSIVKDYGFNSDQMGMMQTMMAMKAHEADADVSKRMADLRAQFMG